jgi:ribosomal-protein-alanine N-acetyltransferase
MAAHNSSAPHGVNLTMIADVTVRLATLSEAADIAAMSRDYIEKGLPWTWTEERVAHSIRDPETNVVVAGENGAIIGFGIMFYASEDAHLILFAVRHAHQRRGVGSAILRWLEDVARAAGAKRIRVECTRENSPARNFYCEHGYHELDIAKKMYRGLKDGVHLEKWFRESA